jgi:hypothetical protein
LVDRNSTGPTNQDHENITTINEDICTVDNNINKGKCLVCSKENDEKWFIIQHVIAKSMQMGEYIF